MSEDKTERPPWKGDAFWQVYFARRHVTPTEDIARRLDYSNERVQTQSYAAVLEACGPVRGRRCLDAGCGLGEFARVLASLGGKVQAFDIVENTIRMLQQQHPAIDWFVADLLDVEALRSRGKFHLIVLVEVLQYVPLSRALHALWSLVAANGRIVGVVPNASCPIVQRASRRFRGRYFGVNIRQLVSVLSELPQVMGFRWRGMTFAQDQDFLPYQVGPWRFDAVLGEEPVPNRFCFVAMRASSRDMASPPAQSEKRDNRKC